MKGFKVSFPLSLSRRPPISPHYPTAIVTLHAVTKACVTLTASADCNDATTNRYVPLRSYVLRQLAMSRRPTMILLHKQQKCSSFLPTVSPFLAHGVDDTQDAGPSNYPDLHLYQIRNADARRDLEKMSERRKSRFRPIRGTSVYVILYLQL